MTEQEEERPSRRQAYLGRIRRWLFRRRKVLLAVIWAAKLMWRLCRYLLGDDPWTFYFTELEALDAA